jgi:hypothetical protein
MLRRQVLWIAAIVAVLIVAAVLLLPRGPSGSPAPSATTALASASPSSSAAASSAAPSASAEPSDAPASGAPASDAPAASDAPSASASVAPTAAASSAAPTTVAFELPETPIEAPLDEAYDTSGASFDPANVGGLEPGDVTARWYVAGDRWVVHYEGLDLEATGELCAGTSFQLPTTGFEHVSNAPTGEAGDPCALFEATRADPPVGVRLCGDQVLYLTAIPTGREGLLFASLEATTDDGAFVGLTSQADPTAGEAPTIDLEVPGCEVVPPPS